MSLWGKSRELIANARRENPVSTCAPPSSFQFDGRYLFFLAPASAYNQEGVSASKSKELTLWVVSLKDGRNDLTPSTWSRVLTPLVQPAEERLSIEEALQRERMRLLSTGLTSYEFDPVSKQFLFTIGGVLYTAQATEVPQDAWKPITPVAVPTNLTSSRMNPALCPTEPRLVAFIHSKDIWVVNTTTGEELRLTFASISNHQRCSAGSPPFVIQEEFDRYIGFYWLHDGLSAAYSPSDHVRGMSEDVLIYRILYEEVDESKVDEVHIVRPSDTLHGLPIVDKFCYPRAGHANAESKIKLVEFPYCKGTNSFVPKGVVEYKMATDLKTCLPWVEYVVRFGWLPDKKSIYLVVLDREQKRLAILKVPVLSFIPVESFSSNTECTVTVLYEETTDIWINVSDISFFFPQSASGGDGKVKFLWSSERTGYRHLYLVTSEGETGTERLTNHQLNRAFSVKWSSFTLRPVTSGSWPVLNHKIQVDLNRGLVFFMAVKDTPLEHHMYVTSFVSEMEPKRLTPDGMTCVARLNEDFSMLAVIASSSTSCSYTKVFNIDHTSLVPSPRCNLFCKTDTHKAIIPKFFSFQNRHGDTMYGAIFLPDQEQQSGKHPTLLHIYGGPRVQTVNRDLKVSRFLQSGVLLSQGYAVLLIDGRGSDNRGLRMESLLQYKMGQVEIEDQLDGLQYAADVFNLDLNRVGLYGWSYGGYMALMGLAQYPQVFKVSISCAPLISWEFYDTAYTERYMGLPESNREAYKKASVLEYVSRLPDSENRLLICHGLLDENVHFYQTSVLISELVKARKPYQLAVYPQERHGLRSPEAQDHFEVTMLTFVLNFL